MSRAKIPPHSPMSPGGSIPPMYDPSFEVAHQMEPTPERPISQHHEYAGHEVPGNLPKHN
jgi:hypothetical protein